jgi:16S rRNA (cytosine967-C5)-methyltransferase
LARHPDARHKVSEASLERLVRRQGELLAMVAEVIPPGGLLVYSTCSLEPEENGEQIDWFLRSHPDFQREPAVDFPSELLSDVGDLAILPQRHGIDGAYAARLKRAA